MLERLRDYASEMVFAARVPYGLKSKLLLAIKTIQFDGVTPERLYQIYLSSEMHSAFTGVPARIDARFRWP
jgi:hypothetical protein